MTEQALNTGEMPNTDFRYEEFEGLLGSYYSTMLPLKDGSEQARADLEAITGILGGLAQRHNVQKPEQAVTKPRPTLHEWGQPEAFNTCFSIIDQMGSFWRDFGVGSEPQTVDMEERLKLGRLLLGVLHRHGVIQAGFEEIDGIQTPVRVLTEDRTKCHQPLQEILTAA